MSLRGAQRRSTLPLKIIHSTQCGPAASGPNPVVSTGFRTRFASSRIERNGSSRGKVLRFARNDSYATHLWKFLVAGILLTAPCFVGSGCGLLQLPLALVGAVFAIVQIPINMALSLIGPATNAATKAAPYALMFAKEDEHQPEWDCYLFHNESGRPSKDFFDQVEFFARNRVVASHYPSSAEDLRKFVHAKDMRCYMVRV